MLRSITNCFTQLYREIMASNYIDNMTLGGVFCRGLSISAKYNTILKVLSSTMLVTIIEMFSIKKHQGLNLPCVTVGRYDVFDKKQ